MGSKLQRVGTSESAKGRKTADELPPEEKRRLSKRAHRRKLANDLPAAEKLRLLDTLHTRSKIQKGVQRSGPVSAAPKASDDPALPKKTSLKKTSRSSSKSATHRFGGRATASGVRYEERIAAAISVKMLLGNRAVVWEGISGADISAITLQTPEAVDDVVVELHGSPESKVFISAKKRSNSIALTSKNSTFTDVVAAFVCQFLSLSETARVKSRLVWAVPSTASRAVTSILQKALDTHRKDAGDDPLASFTGRRQVDEKKAFRSFILETKRRWKKATRKTPTEEELRRFLRKVYVEVYDFFEGHRLERKSEEDLSSHIVADARQAKRTWERLEHYFSEANRHGLRITAALLRQYLTGEGITLQAPPEYAEDVSRLRKLTSANIKRLQEHTVLRFGRNSTDNVHIGRNEETSALLTAVKSGHLLITGEPGSGKSGLIHDAVQQLFEDRVPVILLLAEEISGRDWRGSANMPGLAHPLDEILANWPDGRRGILVTDALDAVRDVETQKTLRRLLRDVQEGNAGWTVVASVREFDLKHGQALRQSFPGGGVAGYASADFVNVAHFHLPRLTDTQLDELGRLRPAILPFIDGAKKNGRVEAIHRLPFYLKLAAELLSDGIKSERLADWNSPAVLLRKFWENRIGEPSEAVVRETALKAICSRMIEARSMLLSKKELSLSAAEHLAIQDLRSRGILQSTKLRNGMLVGDEEIRFTHHLLHDYAIARTLIPTTEERFCAFVLQNPLLPIYYRQSFKFALEELWDADGTRSSFWNSAFQLENVINLHGITRILAPTLAATRVEALSDLQPVLTAVTSASDDQSPGWKALRHLASGLQDADPASIRAGATAWCSFVETVSSLLPKQPSVELPLVHFLARLMVVGAAVGTNEQLSLNVAGRALLHHHVAKGVSKGWQYASHVGIEILCRTFDVAPTETEQSLLTLLVPERLSKFPEDDLFRLANSIKFLGSRGDDLILRLFEAAFADEPEADEWKEMGSRIMGMRMQTKDLWSSVHYSLADYYETRTGEKAGFLTRLACIVWNSVLSRREGHRSAPKVIGHFLFRNVRCELVEDYSHIWGRTFEHEENRIVSHFERLLRGWAAEGNAAKLDEVLDSFACHNRSSLMWTILMEVGAEYPMTLGLKLEAALREPLFLLHPDYTFGSVTLLGALHKTGDTAQRENLETIIVELPAKVELRESEVREPIPDRIAYAQNRLLGVLDSDKIVLRSVLELRRSREALESLPANERRDGFRATSRFLSDEEVMERRGIDLKAPANESLYQLRESLKHSFTGDKKNFDLKQVEQKWSLIGETERVVSKQTTGDPELFKELWGYLVAAAERIAVNAHWLKTNVRWKTIRRILLKGAKDPNPKGDDSEKEKEDGITSWGWPAPRIDAAQGLPFLALRLEKADKEVAAALRNLSEDNSSPLRFNLAHRLAVLEKPAPDLLWELIDRFVAKERFFTVLGALVNSLNYLWVKYSARVLKNLALIADRASAKAPAKHEIHETLARVYLFQFLRTGNSECENYIDSLIANCDSEKVTHALSVQLHNCRDGGWLTATTDNDKPDLHTDLVRARTWNFFKKLLTEAQIKSRQHREALRKLNEAGALESAEAKQIIEKRDRVAQLVDNVASQLYFASGAFDEKTNTKKVALTTEQLRRFWREASPLFADLVKEAHPHTVHQIIQALYHLLPCAPAEVFLMASQSIVSGVAGEIQFEHLAVDDVVRLIQRALADHRDLFQNNAAGVASECLIALLKVLDIFVEAGWSEARQLTHRLEEIYR
jgi:hypothetical protein